MKKTRKLLLIVMALAMTVCMAIGVFSANASMLIMSSGASTPKGSASAIDWAWDENGISPKAMGSVSFVNWSNNPPVGAFQAVPSYGMADPTNNYKVEQDGSTFVMTPGNYMFVGPNGELDLSKVVNLTFTVDPDAAWSTSEGLGRLSFSLYEDKEFLVADGNNCWNFNAGSKAKLLINVWPTTGTNLDNTDRADMINRVTIETASGVIASSEVITIKGNVVNISLFVGDNASQSYCKVNGVNILGSNGFGGLVATDFHESGSGLPSRTAHMGFYSFHKTTQVKLKVSQKENAQVRFQSNVGGFSAPEQTVYAGKSVVLPSPSTISGYTFEGWYTDPGYTVKYNNEPVYGNTTIYAKYLSDSVANVNVTFTSQTGGFAPVTLVVDSGTQLTSIGKVFNSVGHSTTWKYSNGTAYNGQAITSDTTLVAEWSEDALSFYYKDGAYAVNAVTNAPDENGWDQLYTDSAKYDSYEDLATGETLMNRYYGGDRTQGSFETTSDYSIFVLKQAGHIVNTMPLDVRKEIIIKVNYQNWDYNTENDNVSSGLTLDSVATFGLFDSVREALLAGHDSGYGEKGEKVAISHSTLNRTDRYGRNNYGKFTDIKSGVSSTASYKYYRSGGASSDTVRYPDGDNFYEYQWYTLKIGISADGNSNYLVVEHSRTDAKGKNEVVINSEQIPGALAGVKQSDFVDGIAYLHISNIGSTHAYSIRVSQAFNVQKIAPTNGTYKLEYVDESTIDSANGNIYPWKEITSSASVRFDAKLRLTATPNAGYGVAKVFLGEKQLSMNATGGTMEYNMEVWENAEFKVEFGKILTVKFETNGANKTIADLSIIAGNKVTKPTIRLTKSGAKFVDWYADAALTTKFDFSKPVTEDTTIYAGWSDQVSGSVSGGSTGNGGSSSSEIEGGNTLGYRTCGGSLGVTAVFPALIAAAVTGLIIKRKKKD